MILAQPAATASVPEASVAAEGPFTTAVEPFDTAFALLALPDDRNDTTRATVTEVTPAVAARDDSLLLHAPAQAEESSGREPTAKLFEVAEDEEAHEETLAVALGAFE